LYRVRVVDEFLRYQCTCLLSLCYSKETNRA